MPQAPKKPFGLIAALRRSLAVDDLVAAQPALEPVLRARHLLACTSNPTASPDLRALSWACVNWIITFYLDGVAVHGWLKVPQPDCRFVRRALEEHLAKYPVLGRKVTKRLARQLASVIAEHLDKMWAVVPYLVLNSLVVDYAPPGLVRLEWVKLPPDDELVPKILWARPAKERGLDQDPCDGLWEEAMLLLASQASGSLQAHFERVARAKAAKLNFPKSRLSVLAEEAVRQLGRKKPLIQAYHPVGSPGKAVKFLSKTITNAVMDVPSPDDLPPGTIRRAVSVGDLPKDSTPDERRQYAIEADRRKTHRAPGVYTLRELASMWEIHIGRVQRACARVEQARGQLAPRDSKFHRYLRIDENWKRAIATELGIATTAPEMASEAGRPPSEVEAICTALGLSPLRLTEDEAKLVAREMTARGLFGEAE